MKWKLWKCGCNEEECESHPKTVHIFLGYFFILNYCLGTGFLGVPYSFFYSGYLAAIPTLSLAAFLTWLTSVWLLEVMARAQALESHTLSKPMLTVSNGDTVANNSQSEIPAMEDPHTSNQPIFEITSTRKFEIVELSQIFVGKWFKYLYLVIFVIYGFLGCWSFTAVAGSAWATNIPYNFGATSVCNSHAFHHRVLPLGGCLYSYYFSIFLFGIVVITLSVLDLNEQIVVQVILGLLRYIAIGAMIIYCIVKLSQGGDICEERASLQNFTSLVQSNNGHHHNITRYISFKDIVVKFDPAGWVISIPVFVYAFMIHSGVSSLTHPIKQKKYLSWMMLINFASAHFCLLTLGIVVPLWFKASVQETVTLDWASFTRPGNSPQLRVLSYYLILFPSLDVISAYPLTIHCMVNNIYAVITGNDTSKKPKWRYDWILRFSLRFVAALLPLIAAFGTANLIYVLKYAGLVGFGVCFLFPTVLQLRSTFVCIKRFGVTTMQLSLTNSNNISKTDSESETGKSPEMANGKNVKPESNGVDTNGEMSREKAPLLEEDPRNKRHLYMTPYSNRVLSHPVFVGIMGAVEVCLFILSFVGLFVQPHKLRCEIY